MVELTKRRHFRKLSNTTNFSLQLVLDQLSEYKHNNISHLSIQEKNRIAESLLELCQDCARMAAIPQGAFAACKLRENYRERDLIIARMRSGGDRNEAKNMGENKKLMEYNPHKYNDKLMNSIWGFYNRYSPHNIKGNDYELPNENDTQQQLSAVATIAIAKNLAMTVFSDQDWSFKRN